MSPPLGLGTRGASSGDSGHIEQMKMWSQGQVFLKYALKFLFNAYIRPHTRALSNSPLGVVTEACVACCIIWGQSCVSLRMGFDFSASPARGRAAV